MPQLHNHLRSFLQSPRNWRYDMPSYWRSYISNVQPDYNAVSANLNCSQNTTIFPGRRAAPPLNAPPGSHIFRAFDGLRPNNVKVVIVGEDPYPDPTAATGRAFECGNLSHWPSPRQPPQMDRSMLRIMQHWAECRNRQSQGQYLVATHGKRRLISHLHSGYLNFAMPFTRPTPLSLFNH